MPSQSEWTPTQDNWTPPPPADIPSTPQWSPQDTPSPTPKHPTSPMQQLLEMGFADRQRNGALLKQHNNDLQKVIQELVSSNSMDWHVNRHWKKWLGVLSSVTLINLVFHKKNWQTCKVWMRFFVGIWLEEWFFFVSDWGCLRIFFVSNCLVVWIYGWAHCCGIFCGHCLVAWLNDWGDILIFVCG